MPSVYILPVAMSIDDEVFVNYMKCDPLPGPM